MDEIYFGRGSELRNPGLRRNRLFFCCFFWLAYPKMQWDNFRGIGEIQEKAAKSTFPRQIRSSNFGGREGGRGERERESTRGERKYFCCFGEKKKKIRRWKKSKFSFYLKEEGSPTFFRELSHIKWRTNKSLKQLLINWKKFVRPSSFRIENRQDLGVGGEKKTAKN